MDIGELLDRDGVVARLSVSSKRQALFGAAEVAARKLARDPQEILDALMERESLGSTGVGQGVAVPHARLPGLKRMMGVFVRLESPIPFESVDDRPVDLMFVLLAPLDAGVEHLRALARVSRTLRQRDLREQLRQARTADTLYALLARETATSTAA